MRSIFVSKTFVATCIGFCLFSILSCNNEGSEEQNEKPAKKTSKPILTKVEACDQFLALFNKRQTIPFDMVQHFIHVDTLQLKKFGMKYYTIKLLTHEDKYTRLVIAEEKSKVCSNHFIMTYSPRGDMVDKRMIQRHCQVASNRSFDQRIDYELIGNSRIKVTSRYISIKNKDQIAENGMLKKGLKFDEVEKTEEVKEEYLEWKSDGNLQSISPSDE